MSQRTHRGPSERSGGPCQRSSVGTLTRNSLICRQLDYAAFNDPLGPPNANAKSEVTGDGQSVKGVRCSQVFTGAPLYTGIVITTIAFLPDVASAQDVFKLDRPKADLEPGSLVDVHGAGTEAF